MLLTCYLVFEWYLKCAILVSIIWWDQGFFFNLKQPDYQTSAGIYWLSKEVEEIAKNTFFYPFFYKISFSKKNEKNSLRLGKEKMGKHKKRESLDNTQARERVKCRREKCITIINFPNDVKRGWTERDKSILLYDREKFLIVVFVKIFRLSYFPPLSVTLAQRLFSQGAHEVIFYIQKVEEKLGFLKNKAKRKSVSWIEIIFFEKCLWV